MLEQKVEVLNKFGQTIAIFTKDDEEDKLIDPNITLTQNADNILTFSIPENSKKWQEIKDIENIYKVDDHVFSPLFSDSYTHVITEDNQNLIQVKAYERQKLLEKQFVTAWNSKTGFAKIDTFMVVILSKGDLPLKNNDEIVDPTPYALGSAGYVLKGLLHGTGWQVGIVDVDGYFDFETEQLSVYENVLKVQELYGGILIFDSVHQIVHLRDETNYVSYSGYEVIRGKNMKNFEIEIDNALVTKLYVFGEAGLNVASVNDNKIYIENYSYTNETYEGILTDTDIYEPEQLLAWGTRNLLNLCRPRRTMRVGMVDLRLKEGFKNEEFKLNDTVDVIGINEILQFNNNEISIEENSEKLRIIGWDYKVFSPLESTIELGDTTRNTTDIFKKISRSTNAYTSGTIDAELLKNYETGNTVAKDFEIQEEKNITFQTDYEGLDIRVTANKDKIDEDGNLIERLQSNINDLEISTDGLSQTLTKQGGYNLLKNSSAYFDNEFWLGVVKRYSDTEIQNVFFAKNCFLLQDGTISQNIAVPNGSYYVGFKYKKLIPLAECSLTVNNQTIELNSTEFKEEEFTNIEVTDFNIKVSITSDTDDACYVGDIMIVSGAKQNWSANYNEVFTSNIKLGEDLQISSNNADTKFKASVDGIRIINTKSNETVSEFTKVGTYTDELETQKAQIASTIHQRVGSQTWISKI